MDTQSVSGAGMHRTDQWQPLVGEIVEVRLIGEVYRKGMVDAAMPDASGLWIALEGAFQREFIDAPSGFEVWTGLPALERASEMMAEVAQVREQIATRPGDAGGSQRHPDEEQMQSITRPTP